MLSMRHSWTGLGPCNDPTVRKFIAKQDLELFRILLKGRVMAGVSGPLPAPRHGSSLASDQCTGRSRMVEGAGGRAGTCRGARKAWGGGRGGSAALGGYPEVCDPAGVTLLLPLSLNWEWPKGSSHPGR